MPRHEEYTMGRALGDSRARPMLLYGSTPLSPHPIDSTLDYFAAHLLKLRNCNVTIEPGDGTRYDFIICPVFTPRMELLVARVSHAGQFRAASTVGQPSVVGDFNFGESVERLLIDRSEQSWDRKFVHWWLTCLWLEIGAQR